MSYATRMIRNIIADIRATKAATKNIYLQRCFTEAIAHLELAIDAIREQKDTRPRIK